MSAVQGDAGILGSVSSSFACVSNIATVAAGRHQFVELPMRKLVIAAAAIAAVSAAVIAPVEARWRHGHHRGNCLAWYHTVCH
jgi:hypothetical protein